MKKLFAFAIIFAVIFTFSNAQAFEGGSSASAGAAADASAYNGDQINAPASTIGDIGSNNNYEAPGRYFATPGEITYPNAPQAFHQPNQNLDGYLRLPIRAFLQAFPQLETMEGAFIPRETIMALADAQLFGTDIIKNPFSKGLADEGWSGVYVVFVRPDNFTPKGMVTTLSDSKKVNAAATFGDLLKATLEMGSNTIYVIKEGGHLLVRNEGAGIGVTFTGSTIGDSDARAATGVVGAGKSWGNAGYFDHPYIKAVVGVTPEMK